jgi:hypothetical protein
LTDSINAEIPITTAVSSAEDEESSGSSSSSAESAAFIEPAHKHGSWFDSPHVHVIVRNDALLRSLVQLPPIGDAVERVVSRCPEVCPRNAPPPTAPVRPIVAALKIRVYDSDAARISAHELVQWIQFHRLAGIDRILLCDAFDVSRPHEAVLPHIWPLVQSGVVEYFNFSSFAPPFVIDPLMAQVHCYSTVLAGNESEMTWATTIDVDEYIVAPHDHQPGYLRRQLEKLPQSVSALMLENFVMHGVPNASEELLINRVRQRTIEPTLDLHKYFVRPQRVHSYDIHRPVVADNELTINRSSLFFLHAWGARAFGFASTKMPKQLEMRMQPSHEARLLADLLAECAKLCARDEFHWLPKPGPPFWTPLQETPQPN